MVFAFAGDSTITKFFDIVCWLINGFKYHDFFDAEDRILVCDIGHYESEIHTKELLMIVLTKKFVNIAVVLSSIHTNPIGYYKL